MWGAHEGMGWWMVLGTVWFVFFWAVVIWAIAKAIGGGSEQAGHSGTPLDVARRRYASGEITKEQLDQIRRDLNED